MVSVMTSEQICDDLAIRYGTLEAFEIEKKIGKGQFSDVHRARCKEDGRKVALKRIKVNWSYSFYLFKTLMRNVFFRKKAALNVFRKLRLCRFIKQFSFVHNLFIFIFLFCSDLGLWNDGPEGDRRLSEGNSFAREIRSCKHHQVLYFIYWRWSDVHSFRIGWWRRP